MAQIFEVPSTLLDKITIKSRSWNTWDTKVVIGDPFVSNVSQEKLKKDDERDENMAKSMTQMDLLTKHMLNPTPKMVNTMVSKGTRSYEDSEVKAFDEEVWFLSNQVVGFLPTYHRQGKN